MNQLLTKRRGGRRTMLEGLETRMLLSAAPMGCVDVLSRAAISGWAFDADDGAKSIKVDLVIDGATTSIDATVRRDDLTPVVGSRYHGFSYALPTLAPGDHIVEVYARGSDGARTKIGGSTLTNPPPIGYVDVLSDTRIAGWTLDMDNPSASIQIRVDVNGVIGTPTAAASNRADLTALFGSPNHGFNITGNFAGKVVDVYAQDTPSGNWVLLRTNNRLPSGCVDQITSMRVSGWVFDPDLGSAPASVRIDIDGAACTPEQAAQNRPDLTPVVGSPLHGFSILLPALTTGAHDIKVYAIDPGSTSAAPQLIGQGTATNAAPRGCVDQVDATRVAGWAYDPDTGAAPIDVSVYVDGMSFATVSANANRPDLTAVIGSPLHGFSIDLSSLPAGSHQITVTMHDNQAPAAQPEIVLYDGFINNHEPVGYIDAVTNQKIVGWAYDPDTADSPINVDLYVDGAYIGSTSANLPRADLVAATGSANHAFSINLPALSFGAHAVQLFAAESQGTVATLLGNVTVTNNAPRGAVDVLNATTAAGWAFDPEWGAASIAVKVYVDGVESKSVVANTNRADLTPVVGSPNHGYRVTLDPLASGSHELTVYAVDPNNGVLVPLLTRTVLVS